ncbi:hypothetical protein C9374_013912 [Naegleria lovaniensis]|uniref:Uncharacterized protein n=1 Tax=Naegleria lovaniensis TaxID=51637 RepID=A0AA88KUQ1_NAELO|nr:uncharacterized protein C9374_013912 [Naegleria lovaniensis]KAG2389352.1 hypothetical protein C9374_013912 [Naegleria lovaniensis]
MQFLDHVFVIGTCSVVCQQWHQISSKIPFHFNFKHKRRALIPLILNSTLNYELNIIELNLNDMNLGDDFIEKLSSNYGMMTLKHLKILKIRKCCRENGVKWIATSSVMKNLTQLNISDCNVDSDMLSVVATSSYMQNLTKLNISSNGFDDDGVISLSKSEYMSNLTSLNMNRCGFTEIGMISLIHSPYIRNLRSLKYASDHSALSAETVERMASSDQFKHLTKLSLCELLENDSYSTIANSETMKNLTSITINQSILLEHAIQCFASSPFMSNLTEISANDHIHENDNTSGGELAIAQSKYLKKLKRLHIYSRNDQVLKELFTSENVKNLTELSGVMYLSINRYLTKLKYLRLVDFPDDAIESICQSENISTLIALELRSDRQNSSSSLISIAKSPFLKNLQQLCLGFIDYPNKGFEELCASQNMKHLQVLEIGNLSTNALECIRESPYLNQLRVLQLLADGYWFYIYGNIQNCTVLANCSNMSNLTELDLSFNAIDDESAVAIANGSHLNNLRKLWLFENAVGNEGFLALLKSSCLRLDYLDLAYNSIKDDAVEDWNELVPYATYMTLLKLEGNDITEEHLSLVCRWF